MGVEDDVVLIKRANSREFVLAEEFVRRKYQKEFGTEPKNIWPDCLAALSQGEVVGVVCLQFSEGESFEVEDYFEFNFSILGSPRSEFVSFGKWVTDRPALAKSLVYAAVAHAQGRGRKFCLNCAKPDLLSFLRRSYRLRFNTFAVPVRFDRIPSEDLNFFTTKPYPRLYIGSLEQWYNAVKSGTPANIQISV